MGDISITCKTLNVVKRQSKFFLAVSLNTLEGDILRGVAGANQQQPQTLELVGLPKLWKATGEISSKKNSSDFS